MFKTLIYQTLRPVVTASLCSYNSYKNSLIQFWMKCCLYQTTGWARLKACFGPFINKWQATHLSKYSYGPLQTQITHTHKSHTNIITLLSVGEPCAQYLAQKTTGHRPQSQATVTGHSHGYTTNYLRTKAWVMRHDVLLNHNHHIQFSSSSGSVLHTVISRCAALYCFFYRLCGKKHFNIWWCHESTR